MSIKNIGVLAFASAVAAAGHGHYGAHSKLHAQGTGSSAAAIPTDLPACWGTCFEEAGVSSPAALCDNKKASNCIKTACATADVASYEAWLKKQCNSAPYPSGSSNSTLVAPTGTGVSSGYSTSICTETSTLIYKTTTAYSTYLITHTLSPSAPGGYGSETDVPVGPATETGSAPGGYGSDAPSGSPSTPSGTPNSPIGGEGDDEECSEVTVTETERTTVTVTAGNGGAPSSAPGTYDAPTSEASEAPSSPAPAPTSYAASTTESPVAEAPSSYVSQAGGPPSYGAPSSMDVPSSAAPTSEAPAATSSKPKPSSPPTYDSGFRGKRGIAYNDSSMVVPAMMDSSKIGWASNWEGIAKGFEHSDITFIPTLHGGDSYWTEMWPEQVAAAKAAGQPYLFGPNEPDMVSQANLLPEDCAQLWRDHMNDYGSDFKLVAPSISSGVGKNIGIDWLDQFMGNCSDCQIDAINQHWYNSDGNFLDNFEQTIEAASKYGKPVFVGEFGAIGSDAEISDFMGKAMKSMDDNDNVIGYAYFMAYEGLLVNGGALSPTGETYCNGE